MEEFVTASESVKLGKAAGLDGIYLEFIKNSGRKSKEKIVLFFNGFISTSKLVISILKS
jgi:hypothetical protein